MNNYALKVLLILLIIFGATPVLADELELWLGKVEFAQLRDAKNEDGEPELVIEWLSRRYKPLEEVNIEALSNSNHSIKAVPTNEYFVTTIRSQEMPRELAMELVKKANENKPTAVHYATKQFIGTINNRSAIFIGGGNGSIYNNKLIVK